MAIEGLAINLNQNTTSRQKFFETLKDNALKIALNALVNRLSILNAKLYFRLESFLFHCEVKY